MNSQYSEDDARYHTSRIKDRIDELITMMRDRTDKVDDPKAEALLETSAEVLIGLQTAYNHYEHEVEEAWR